MAQALPPELRDAVVAAAKAMVAEHENQSAASRAAKKKGIKLDQSTFSDLLGDKPKAGIAVAKRVADYYGVTLDGLVRKFSDGGERKVVRAGDVAGWEEAVQTAKQKHASYAAILPWELAAMVELPVAPDQATAEFAFAVANLLATFAETTVVRKRRKM